MEPVGGRNAHSQSLQVRDTFEIPRAREAVMEVAWGSGLDATAAVDATIIAAELLENGLTHGSPPVWVRAERVTEGVMEVAVSDSSTRVVVLPDAPQWPGSEEESGRGLHLCVALARQVRVDVHESGKTVTAEVHRLPGG